jgi:predicted amidophosphoribosyltransferase
MDYTFVRIDNPLNSTEFSSCCGLAVLREDTKCPGCKKPVIRYGRPRSNNCAMCGKPRTKCNC